MVLLTKRLQMQAFRQCKGRYLLLNNKKNPRVKLPDFLHNKVCGMVYLFSEFALVKAMISEM
jgi:hypothetical protein